MNGPMPEVETSWGYGPVWGVEEFDGDEGPVQQEVYLYSCWTVRCMRHGFEWAEDEERKAQTAAASPDLFCRSCAEEWATWLAKQPPPPASDLDGDRHRELAGIRAAEEYERHGGAESAEHPEGARR